MFSIEPDFKNTKNKKKIPVFPGSDTDIRVTIR